MRGRVSSESDWNVVNCRSAVEQSALYGPAALPFCVYLFTSTEDGRFSFHFFSPSFPISVFISSAFACSYASLVSSLRLPTDNRVFTGLFMESDWVLLFFIGSYRVQLNLLALIAMFISLGSTETERVWFFGVFFSISISISSSIALSTLPFSFRLSYPVKTGFHWVYLSRFNSSGVNRTELVFIYIIPHRTLITKFIWDLLIWLNF